LRSLLSETRLSAAHPDNEIDYRRRRHQQRNRQSDRGENETGRGLARRHDLVCGLGSGDHGANEIVAFPHQIDEHRRHVRGEHPRFPASDDEHDRAVRAFASAVGEGDLSSLVAVLDPDVVWTSDGGGLATAARKPLRGAARVGRGWAALTARLVREPFEITLNGRLGLVVSSEDGHRAALSFVVADGRITRIDAIRNPEKLRRLSP